MYISNLMFILVIFQCHTDANIPDEKSRLNSILYNDETPLPSMYLPLNCKNFKQKGIIAWMIHEGIDVPAEDKMLFEKCGNLNKDYIVGETFLFGERSMEKMTRYSRYLRKLLKKPKKNMHQTQNISKDIRILNNKYLIKVREIQGNNVISINYYALQKATLMFAVIILIIMVVSAFVTIFAFINYREYPGRTIKRRY